MTKYTTLGGRVDCTQCNALSKHTRQRCQESAIKGKAKCKFHGERRTGSRTPEGKARQIVANTVHCRETRAIREERSAKMADLYKLEMPGRELGFISGPTIGPLINPHNRYRPMPILWLFCPT